MNGWHPLAFLFGTGLDEWALLGAIAFLLFGPKRLPEIARTIGRTLERLRRAAADFREQVEKLDDQPPASAPERPEISPPVAPAPTDSSSPAPAPSSAQRPPSTPNPEP